ncbi:tetratricopeptide repeat protein [Cystobacter ferrugineus]|uniref:Tetratricopeptide repeat protein n=1 Tax=Cystobacter ferrugineus TaxID=83449 RepID=A0A1L9AZ28_9BACT|nr:tetratricopeptide repeat protein [Cystobacter ferrugineus]OJH35278.1 hypothetical protein BON30_40235 [Cystobacter ferrugineus]
MSALSLTAKGEEEWQALRYHIEWSKGFVLVFLFVPDESIQTLLRERLERICLMRTAPLEKVSPRDPATLIEDVLEPIRQPSSVLTEAHSPLWIDLASGRGDEWGRARDNLLSRVNEHREWLRRLERPVVWVLPSGYRPRLREIAPDLWAIRGYSLDLGEQGLTAAENEAVAPMDPPEPERAMDLGSTHSAANSVDEALLKEWARIEHTPSKEPGVFYAGWRAADVALRLGRLELARDISADVLARARNLVSEDQDATNWLSTALHQVGDVAQAMGRLEEAEEAHRESLELRRGLRERLGDTPQVLRDLSVSLTLLADVLGARGKIDDALKNYDEARRLRQRLALALPHIVEHEFVVKALDKLIEDLRHTPPQQP